MIQIIYRSRQTHPLSLDDLRAILDISRIKNAGMGITGVLFYDGAEFIQVLEGGEAEIQCLLGSILRDPRHRDVEQLSQLVIREREFGSWAMAFAHPEALGGGEDSLLDYDDDLVDFDMTASRARQFLFMFVEGMLKQAPPFQGNSSFTVHMSQGADIVSMVSADSPRSYLVELGHTIALSMPEVKVSVTTHDAGEVQFNSQGELGEGAIELF